MNRINRIETREEIRDKRFWEMSKLILFVSSDKQSSTGVMFQNRSRTLTRCSSLQGSWCISY